MSPDWSDVMRFPNILCEKIRYQAATHNGCELCTAVKTASLFVAIKFLQQRRFFSFLKVLV